jgi:hypothetical protein
MRRLNVKPHHYVDIFVACFPVIRSICTSLAHGLGLEAQAAHNAHRAPPGNRYFFFHE